MALLRVLCEAQSLLQIDLYAVTVDHGLRDASAEHTLVSERCETLGIPWELVRVQVCTKKGSLQASARSLRLEALQRIARQPRS